MPPQGSPQAGGGARESIFKRGETKVSPQEILHGQAPDKVPMAAWPEGVGGLKGCTRALHAAGVPGAVLELKNRAP